MADSATVAEINIKEAAALLRCSRDTTRRLLESGDIEGYRLTPRGHWRVHRDSVVRYLASLRRKDK